MLIQKQVNLQPWHTFSTASTAAELIQVSSQKEALEAMSAWQEKPYLVLGGGSNLLFVHNQIERVLKISLTGISPVEDSSEYVLVDVAAGVSWHEWVMLSLENAWFGLENLALIPGQVGAAPMQNIGAYGVEVRHFIDSVEAIDRKTQHIHRISNSDCAFGYRSSAFKTAWKNRYVISSVRFRLAKAKHKINHEYGAIKEELSQMGIHPDGASPSEVAQAVMAIRKSKLPDPNEIGNAGSFFKNPSVAPELAEALKSKHPNMPHYPSEEAGRVKLAAGWLIEQAGWKGFREGDAGVHVRQALVLVNYGSASGQQSWNLAGQIQRSVQQQFGVELEPEVNAI
jgi:UDP-N-acetylmuramate dehydrogenase